MKNEEEEKLHCNQMKNRHNKPLLYPQRNLPSKIISKDFAVRLKTMSNAAMIATALLNSRAQRFLIVVSFMEIFSPSTFHLFMSTSHAVLEVLQLYSQPVRCLTVQRIILDLIFFFLNALVQRCQMWIALGIY